jgi:hypothetical protein
MGSEARGEVCPCPSSAGGAASSEPVVEPNWLKRGDANKWKPLGQPAREHFPCRSNRSE